jgi:hypothetical protein
MSGKFIQRSRHGTVYYFRRRVPCELRRRLQRVHFYASLHTQELAEAKRRARVLAVVTDRLFSELRYSQGDDEKTPDDSKQAGIRPYNKIMETILETGYELDIRWDPIAQKPTLKATEVKPGDESSVMNLARSLLQIVGTAEASGVIAPPKSPTPSVDEAIAAKLAAPGLKPTTLKEYKRAFELFRSRVGGGTAAGTIRRVCRLRRRPRRVVAKDQGFHHYGGRDALQLLRLP